jgi:hypothetical protein
VSTPTGTTLRIILVLFGVFGAAISPARSSALAKDIPSPAHVIVVIEENHGYSDIIGSAEAPYINTLATAGASFTDSHAITHPSLPNYLALFSGSTQGVTDDSCPHSFSASDLESALIDARLTFVGYSEALPSTGSQVCGSGNYARKHVPWSDFSDDPMGNNRPFSGFPLNFVGLPTVSWIIPNEINDMSRGSILQADLWLRNNLSRYVAWAQNNNSLLIVDWDEDHSLWGNHIPTIFVGPMVSPGQYSERINHYNVLRTIEDMFGLPHLGQSAAVTPIADVWQ